MNWTKIRIGLLALSSFFMHFASSSQESNVEFFLNSYAGKYPYVPYYIWSNQLGQMNDTTGNMLGVSLYADGKWKLPDSNTAIKGGFRLYNKYAAGNNELKFLELFAGVETKLFSGTAGWFADSLVQNNLSMTNGNFLSSQNAEPYFRVRVGTNGFIPVGKKDLRISALWEEGTLGDHNFVRHAKVHHKNLHFRTGDFDKGEFTAGIDHYAIWGGTSRSAGDLPQKPMDYIRTVFSLPGGKNASEGDQKNVNGNQLGQYIFTYRKQLNNKVMEARLVHPFEDFSGMVFVNFPDNLYSFSLDYDDHPLFKRILLEFMYTKHQSGDDIDKKTGEYRHRNGTDDYFNHGTYRTFSHKGLMLGSPMFLPTLATNDGVTFSLENNRIMAFSTGLQGTLFQDILNWKTIVTKSYHYGRYGAPYDPVREQLYTYTEISFYFPSTPVLAKIAVSWDQGDLQPEQYRNQIYSMFSLGVTF